MKRKHVIITLFLCALVFSLAVVLNTWTQDKLSKEEKRFDFDQDEELSTSEKEFMVRVMRLEMPEAPNSARARSVKCKVESEIDLAEEVGSVEGEVLGDLQGHA